MNSKQFTRWMSAISSGLLYVIAAIVLFFAYLDYQDAGWNWLEWDLMFLTGLLAFIVALYFARSTPDRMIQTLDRLANRCAFEASDDQLIALKSRLQLRAQRFASIGTVLVGLILLVSFIGAFQKNIVTKIPETLLETFLGAVAGYYIGQMVAYGFLGQLTRKENIAVVAKPGHIDKAAGLKPIGDYYFYQAMIIAIPCLYIAVWWFLILFVPIFQRHYGHWFEVYLGLLAVALALETLSFIVPMIVFHEIMRKQKIVYLNKADGISDEILQLEGQLLAAPDAKAISDVQKELDFLREKYWEIEQMPTWPMDEPTRRKFTVNNLLLFLPFISDVVKTSAPVQKLFEWIAKIFSVQ